MINEIIRKIKEEELESVVNITTNAYTGLDLNSKHGRKSTLDDIKKSFKNDNTIGYYGLFKDDKLSGTICIYDFEMNLLNQIINVHGLGSVAVDLLNKKEKVGFNLIKFFLDDGAAKGKSLAALYPFRIDFYKNLGFGYGTLVYQYNIKTSQIINYGNKGVLQYLDTKNIIELKDFYNNLAKKQNGLMLRTNCQIESLLSEDKSLVIGSYDNNELTGYLFFNFEKDNIGHPGVNNIIVKELLYKDSTTLKSLLTFLSTQYDQVNNIKINTFDKDFRFLFDNPESIDRKLIYPISNNIANMCSGILYRVLNVKKLFIDLTNVNFNNENVNIKLTICDNLIADNNMEHFIEFNNGYATYKQIDDYDVEIQINISEFSSLITNSINLKKLYEYNSIIISDVRYLDRLDKMFNFGNNPVCYTIF